MYGHKVVVMHIALVYSGRYHIRQALELETLSSVIKKEGHRVSFVYDPDTFGVTDNVLYMPGLARRVSSRKILESAILEKTPDVVIFSVLPSTYKGLKSATIRIKAAHNIPIVFIGLHPTLVPERIMRDRCIDYVIQGEVEGVIGSFLSALKECKGLNKVGNLWYRERGAVRFTFLKDLVDLDELPLPDKELFYPFVDSKVSYAALISRGCPCNCSYCEESCVKQLYGSRFFRRKCVDAVIYELLVAKYRYRFSEVIFKDSYLLGNHLWLEEFIELYKKKIAVPFKCFCTISGFNSKIAALLKKGGCYCVEFGLQTWNEKVRKNVLLRTETNADALKTFNICDMERLWYDVDHMFNIPGELTADHMEGAFKYKRLSYLNRIKVHYLAYLPKALILDFAHKNKMVPEGMKCLVEEGSDSDFYNQDDYYCRNRSLVEGFSVLYKLLPIIPRRLIPFINNRRRVFWLGLLPSPLIALFQYILSRRSSDPRFIIYLRLYPRKILLSLWRRFH